MKNWLEPDRRTPRAQVYDRAIAWCLAGLLLLAYLATYTGYIQSSDGLAMFATAENMVRRSAIDSNQILWMGAQQGNLGPDGNLYSRKGVGMTLLALPLVWVATLWQSIGLVHTALLLNPLLTAWTGALVYLTGRRLNWTPGISVLAALAFGLGTLAWPYTQTFFSDPVCMWGLFAGAYGLLAHAQTGRKRYLFLAAVAWSIAYLARVVNLITLPLYAAGLVFAVRAALPTLADQTWRDLPARLWRDAWRPLITFTVPIVLAGLFSLYWNWARYGSIWDSGYVETERFDAVWWFGISGLLFGPARGFFWYSPILLLALWGGFQLWRTARAVTLFTLIIAGGYVLLYGKWYMWHGGYSWGPRFLVPILPFVTLLAGATFQSIQARNSLWLKAAIGLLAGLSLLVQILGLMVPFDRVQNWLDATVQPLFAPETFTTLQLSPLLRQWDYFRLEHFHIFWLRPFAPDSPGWNWNLGLVCALLLLLMVLGTALIRRLLAGAQEIARQPHTSPYFNYTLWETTTRPFVIGAGLICVLLLTTLYARELHTPYHQVAQRIAQMEQPGDAILHLRPAETQQFANHYHGHLPVYGHHDSATLDPARREWQAQMRQDYNRIWVVAGMGTADQSGWETTFRTEDFLLYDFRAPAGTGERLLLYASSQSQPLLEAGLGTIFGDPAHSGSITLENGWIRLSGYGLLPETHAGGELILALHWESLQPVDKNYHVFVHLLNQEGERLAQRDGQPVQWMRPTNTWQPGEEIVDRYGMLLSADLPGGEYAVAVGLYDPESGQRLPVSAGPSNFAIELGPILVRPDS